MKRRYPTDTEAGIRTIAQIRNLPAGQLTDEEFVKMFFDRFQAHAMLMMYCDGDGWQSFGRLKKKAKFRQYYRTILERTEKLFDNTDIQEIE